MKIFDFLKRIMKNEKRLPKASDPIPKEEKQYYKPDSYYTRRPYESVASGPDVITFEERKKTCIPSRTGLYVAEILLLEYCTYGKYPNPQNGYPGLWWFSYGIRNVGAVLKSLEIRGYIKYGSVKKEVKRLKVEELKELLSKHGLPTDGKKAELVERVTVNIDESLLVSIGLEPKYELTELGQTELEENAYVPYMHKFHHKTNGDFGGDFAFNVWSINKLLGNGDKSNWKEIVDQEESRVFDEMKKRHEESMERLSEIDPELYQKLKNKEIQAEYIKQTEERLSGDTDALIRFWESIWNGMGLLYNSSMDLFRLPDLYIIAERYDDAINFCNYIKDTKPDYAEKADGYIEKIEKMKLKKQRQTKKDDH